MTCLPSVIQYNDFFEPLTVRRPLSVLDARSPRHFVAQVDRLPAIARRYACTSASVLHAHSANSLRRAPAMAKPPAQSP